MQTSEATSNREPSVVIAHDFTETYGGAERIAAQIAAVFPSAPFYSIIGRDEVAQRMGVADRFHSLLGARAPLLDRYRWLTPLYPAIVRRRRLPAADLLVTSSYAFAHGFTTKNRAPQLCYCYSPLRFAWSMTDDYAARLPGGAIGRLAARGLAARLRRADRRAATRVTRFVAESRQVADQIHDAYGRDADVIYPGVDCELFSPAPEAEEPGGFILFCGRLIEPYKRPTAVVEAMARFPGRRLVVAGDGPELERLRKLATPNVEFVGQVGDDELVGLMRACSFAVFPSHDDFGLIPVEVMACGRPVLAFAGGGALETVVAGQTGAFFSDTTAAGVAAAIEAFDPDAYDPAEIRAHALGFSADRFNEAIHAAAMELLDRHE